MNRKFLSATALKAMTIAVTAAVLLTSSPTASYAHDMRERKAMHITDEQVSVQYIGTNDNSYMFNIRFDNPSLQKFSVIVKDDDGIVVYQEQFNDAHFAKNFHLPKIDGSIRPTFIVRAGNRQVERSFEVSTRLTQNVVVTKL